MAFENDLLAQARVLAMAEPGDLLQVSLRRAISTAYYALFHLLIAESTRLLVPTQPSGLTDRVSRAYMHREMNRICDWFSKSQLPEELRALLPDGASAELRLVATTFIQLQQEGHSADYDTGFEAIRSFTLLRITEAESAFSSWSKIRGTDEANVFLTALAFGARWSK